MKYHHFIFVISAVSLNLSVAIAEEVGSSQQSILGGDPVAVGELEAIGRIPGCSATLIEPDLVLTAAHCVCSGETTRTGCRANSDFTLVNVRPINDPNTIVNESLTRQNIGFSGAVNVHPQYTSTGWLSHDFATIRLTQKVSQLAVGVEPIPLELPTQRPKIGDDLTIVGFGTGSPCTVADAGKRAVTLPLREISTGNVTMRVGTPNAGACPGDSGGPALNDGGHVVGVSSTINGNYDPTDQAYKWLYPDTSKVGPNGVHGMHFERRDRHQFNLVSVYPLSVNGIITYAWDNVRDPGQNGYIRRLNVINETDQPVTFKHKVQPLDLTKVQHVVEIDEVASVHAQAKRGYHFEMRDQHQFYLESVYPVTVNGRVTYEWDNVRDPNSNNYIRRLNVINNSSFPVQFKIKVVKLVESGRSGLTPHHVTAAALQGLIKSEVLDATKVVGSKGKHGFHFERQDKHRFYLESVYPITEGGRITYQYDNVRDLGSLGYIRRLTVMNQSDSPTTFKAKVLKVSVNKQQLNQASN